MGKDYRKTNKSSDIRRALLKKGFHEDQTKIDGHTAYVITGGTGKEIYTFMSRGGHGKAALSEKLLHDMSRQLSFQNYADFQNSYPAQCPKMITERIYPHTVFSITEDASALVAESSSMF